MDSMFFGTFLRVPVFGEFTNCSGARERTLPILPRRCPVPTIVIPKSVFSHFLINSGSYNGFKVWHFRRRDNFGSKFVRGTVELWTQISLYVKVRAKVRMAGGGGGSGGVHCGPQYGEGVLGGPVAG